MKFFLAHFVPASFKCVTYGQWLFSMDIIPSDIRPFDVGNSEVTPLCDELCQRLQTASKSGSESSTLFSFELCLIEKGFSCSIGLRVMPGPVTTALAEMLGPEFKIQIQLSCTAQLLCSEQEQLGEDHELNSSEMKFGQYGDYIFEDTKFLTGDDFAKSYKPEKLTIVVICNGTDKMRVNRKMLQGEVGSDVAIIPGKGNQVKAHKCVLMSHSSVLNTMFQSDKGSRRTVKMQDLSEEGVRGLLAYLYCWETIEPNAKSEVAFDMFYAGHKYDIPVLAVEMKELLLSKPGEWYDVDVAVKLFLMGRNLSVDGERLKMKAIQVMKGNFGNFKKSPTYVALFKEDPEVAMEFCEYFAA